MNVEYINPFLTAAVSAFDMMLGWKLTRGTPFLKTDYQPEHEVSGVIGLSGQARGIVILGLSRDVALGAAEILLQERPEKINADVVDAVGELANIIAGSAKAKLESLHLSISLPTVITGKGHSIEFPSQVKPICIPFGSEHGPITVEVGLTDQVVARHAS